MTINIISQKQASVNKKTAKNQKNYRKK